uniref:Uncharacterized protein n=1 Tax=Arundo donax TaxID=35708 RepID=A0A0A8YCJ5_ARUDO
MPAMQKQPATRF